MKKFFMLLVLLGAVVLPLHAQKLGSVIRFRSVEIKLDGIPDEDFWSKVPVLDDFVRYGKKNVPLTASTSVRICLDDKNLYFALECDEPAGTFAGAPDNTSPWQADAVEIFFGSLEGHDWYRQIVFGLNGRGYYEFMREEDLRRAVKNNGRSWSAEMVIPLEKLGNMPGDKLLFNMFRHRVNAREMQTFAQLQWAGEMDRYAVLHIHTPPETVRYAPWTAQITADSAMVCWGSIGACRSFLEYREKGKADYRTVYADVQGYVADRSRTLHTVRLAGLKPGTVYKYRINGDVKGEFTTADPKEADFTFAAISDTHTRSWQILSQLDKPHVKSADIFFHLGDTVSGVNGLGSYHDALLAPMSKSGKNFYVVRGNHEGRGNAPGIFLDTVYPHGRKAYCGFLHKGVYFVILDTSDEFDHDPEFLAEQRKWLWQTVSGDEFKNAQFRVLLTHYALHVINNDMLHRLFDSLPEKAQNAFDLALAGHHHCDILILPGSNRMVSKHPKYSNRPPEKVMPFLRLINYGGTFGVKKSAGALTVTRYDGEGNVIDTFAVPRKKVQ